MRTCCVAAAGLLAAALVAGCDGGPKTGEVTGTVTVDGEVPMDGASITFIPTDGTSASGGDTLREGGKYKVKVAVGPCKVQIRVPEPDAKKRQAAGPGGGLWIKESLPEKYHEKTELTYDVKPGTQEKNWEVSKKK